ncbi:gp16 [Hemileuca sp. nucleopolyhedrovirus]|uniref:Gp16 n=1 Tax=Hemileuca sp. nucleopolyhedrovirus TaxID=1367203 RepID=S5MQJ1_9ABAC|nr:gp16 [Hemileuca sp. nucleopolyhedrovirus]AGR56869.1 gp16 [Hemileuca sp. nucleopolyhedrovirus]
MNYSAIVLIMLVVYLWHAGSLVREISFIKSLLIETYDMIECKFGLLTGEFLSFKNETIRLLEHLHDKTRYTIDVVLNNSRKIDTINKKIDFMIDRYALNNN